MAHQPSFRCGYLSVLLPASTPDSRVRPLVRQLVVDALAATGEWPISVRIVSSQGVSGGRMKRWFVEYETGPHGEIADPRDLFD